MTATTMQIGISTWVWTSPADDEVLARLIPRIAEMGYDVVEIPVETLGQFDLVAHAPALFPTGENPRHGIDMAGFPLGEAPEERYADDADVTVEEVECLAACGNAPSMQVNYEFHEHLNPQIAEALRDLLLRTPIHDAAANVSSTAVPPTASLGCVIVMMSRTVA